MSVVEPAGCLAEMRTELLKWHVQLKTMRVGSAELCYLHSHLSLFCSSTGLRAWASSLQAVSATKLQGKQKRSQGGPPPGRAVEDPGEPTEAQGNKKPQAAPVPQTWEGYVLGAQALRETRARS